MKNKLIILIVVVVVAIIVSAMIFLFNSKRQQDEKEYFMQNGVIIAPDGTEYIHLANEGLIVAFGNSTLPQLDLSPDNCIRFEFIKWENIHRGDSYTPDIMHMSCNEGIKNKDEIKEFLEDIRSQKSPNEAGLYDLVRKPGGMLENCYKYIFNYN